MMQMLLHWAICVVLSAITLGILNMVIGVGFNIPAILVTGSVIFFLGQKKDSK